jgi:hypothetical protein
MELELGMDGSNGIAIGGGIQIAHGGFQWNFN